MSVGEDMRGRLSVGMSGCRREPFLEVGLKMSVGESVRVSECGIEGESQSVCCELMWES